MQEVEITLTVPQAKLLLIAAVDSEEYLLDVGNETRSKAVSAIVKVIENAIHDAEGGASRPRTIQRIAAMTRSSHD